MTIEAGVANALGFVRIALAILALVLGGVAAYKVMFSLMSVDAKTAAEVAACFAIVYFCLSGK